MGRTVHCVVAAVLALALCDAAPRVDIRIIPRPRTEPELPIVGPVPYRAPADPAGPFAGYADSLGCITDFPGVIEGKNVLIDLCHLKNVTFIEIPAAASDVAGTSEAESDTAASENQPSSEEANEPPLTRRQILGVFRGWNLDPIHKKFKHAIFDDGDICGEYGTERLAVAMELVRTAQFDAVPRLYDVRKVSSCSYAMRVEAYVAEYELDAANSIHTPGVLDISDANEVLPQICGEMKCQYSHIAGRIDVVKQEIESLKKSLEDFVSAEPTSIAAFSASAATSIIKSSTDVMEKSLEMLQSIEQLEQAAQDTRATATAAASAVTAIETTEVTATS